MNKRKKRISEGLEKADEADRRLEEIGLVQKEKLKESQQRALELLREAEKDAKEQEKKILATAALREQEIIKRAQEKAVEQEKEAYAKAQSQTVELVKQILIKTVQIAPTAVDETLIQKVATENQKLS